MKKTFKSHKNDSDYSESYKKFTYNYGLSASTIYNKSVVDHIVEKLVEIENQMLEKAIEEQRTKQGSEFNKILAEFKYMKLDEQNCVIYSFTDLLKRMNEIKNEEMELHND